MTQVLRSIYNQNKGPFIKILTGYASEDTAFLIESYPYGSLRCQMKVWIETTKQGQRAVTMTSNPKKPYLVWNKPHKSTYSMITIMFLDDNGHVKFDGLSQYAWKEHVERFIEKYGLDLADEYQNTILGMFIKLHKIELKG